MDKDTIVLVRCHYIEEEGGWWAEEVYTGLRAVGSTPSKALSDLALMLPEDFEVTNETED